MALYFQEFLIIYNWKNIYTFSNKIEKENDEDIKTAVDAILNKYGSWSASSLSAWTHIEGSPWWKVIKEQEAAMNSIIPNDYIAEYFKENVLAE